MYIEAKHKRIEAERKLDILQSMLLKAEEEMEELDRLERLNSFV